MWGEDQGSEPFWAYHWAILCLSLGHSVPISGAFCAYLWGILGYARGQGGLLLGAMACM